MFFHVLEYLGYFELLMSNVRLMFWTLHVVRWPSKWKMSMIFGSLSDGVSVPDYGLVVVYYVIFTSETVDYAAII